MGVIDERGQIWKWLTVQGLDWTFEFEWVDDDGLPDPDNTPAVWMGQIRTGEGRTSDDDLIAEFDITVTGAVIDGKVADTFDYGYGCWWYEIAYDENDGVGEPSWQPVLRGPFVVDPSSLAAAEGS